MSRPMLCFGLKTADYRFGTCLCKGRTGSLRQAITCKSCNFADRFRKFLVEILCIHGSLEDIARSGGRRIGGTLPEHGLRACCKGGALIIRIKFWGGAD